jgi:hypothetical protein
VVLQNLCIFDTLELDLDDEGFTISYHETEEDALAITNSIISEDIYTSIENNQTLYVRIYDLDNDIEYFVQIQLNAIIC